MSEPDDFGSALREALTNSPCRGLWLRQKQAFPDSCLANPVTHERLSTIEPEAD